MAFLSSGMSGMKKKGRASRRPIKSFMKSYPHTAALMEKAAKLSKENPLLKFKKLYGNDRGAFLYKQAMRPRSLKGKKIGRLC